MAKERFVPSLSRYLAIVGVYMLCLVVLKVVEYFWLGIAAAGGGHVWLNAIVYNLIVTSWVALGVGVLYCLVRLLSQKLALWLAALLYAVLLLAEIGLTMYVSHNGFLLGCELVARPFSETLLAVKGAVGVVLPIVLPLVLLGAFVALALWRAKRHTPAVWAVLVVMVVMILLSLIFKMSHLVQQQFSYYVINKTHYLVVDSQRYLRSIHGASASDSAQIEYDENLIASLHATHPEWGTPIDPHYPLERVTPVDTFLSPFFSQSSTPPNIVIILVESLGAEYMGTGVMPFVDSLASTGLYWPNCLSTTTRSYGAIPGITGSVGGPKCFQFGIMPNHNSLLSLVKGVGYNTRAYYGGDFNFDCIYEYLTAQHIDYLSPFYQEFEASPTRDPGNWWGYNDDSLFIRTLQDLQTFSRQKHQTPFFSLITTITMHEPLRLTDAAKQKDYEQRAAKLSRPTIGDKLASSFPAALFTNDCLQRFIHEYSRLPEYENTIFVITGDHSSGRQKGDKLSLHHVPLILWSPMIQRPATFRHVVTHNDVAPGLYGLLTSHYGLPAHSTVHWLGDGLGPTPKTLLVVNYVHAIYDIIFHNHYYQSADGFFTEELYSFGDDLKLQPCSDASVLDSCRQQLKWMKYLYSYTYNTNHLTAHPVSTRQYTTVYKSRLATDAVYAVPENSSNQAPPSECVIVPTTLLRNCEGYSTVRVTLEADAIVEGDLSMDQHPKLIFNFWGDNSMSYNELICKFFTNGKHVVVSKEFALSTEMPNSLQVVLRPPSSDEDRLPGSSVTLTNTLITFEYGK